MDRLDLLRLTLLVIAALCAQLALATRNLPTDRARGSPADPGNLLTSRFAYASPMLLTFQGFVLSASSQHPEPVVLHALVKAKVLKTGLYIIRAVLTTQRTALQSDEGFAPSLENVTMCLEYQESRPPNEPARWSALPFTLLGLRDPKGPYTLELVMPRSADTTQLRLRLFDWPIYYSVDIHKLLEQNLSGKEKVTQGFFRHAVVMPHVQCGNPETSAQVLATHITYHVALGFDLYLLYTWSSDLISAIMSNTVTASLVTDGILRMVSLESLQFPTYDDKRSDKSFPFHQSYDPTKNFIYNHAALTLWGELFHLAVLDVDEFFATYPRFASVGSWFRTCFPRVHMIRSSRVDAVCEKCALSGETELGYFSKHWNASNPTNILQNFNRVASFSSDPKSIFWPDKVGQVWVHEPFSLPGSRSVTVSAQDQLEGHADRCVYVVHLYNLFKHRIVYDPRVQKHPVITWVHQHV